MGTKMGLEHDSLTPSKPEIPKTRTTGPLAVKSIGSKSNSNDYP